MGRCMFCLLLGLTALYSCSKKEKEVQLPLGVWENVTDFPDVSHPGSVAFVLNDIAFIGAGTLWAKDFYAYTPSTNQWIKIADLPRGRLQALGFSLLGKGYVLGGYDSTGDLNDFWEYDPAQNAWTHLPDFPGAARTSATVLTLGNKAYLGTGWTHLAGSGVQMQLSDWWEYDPLSKAWTRKTDFPGGPCSFAAGIGLGTKAYLGLAGPGLSPGRQWWEYDPTLDKWKQLADCPGTPRYGAGIFVLKDKIYAGNGSKGQGADPKYYIYDWWEYDKEKDRWRAVASSPQLRAVGVSFSIDDVGYWGLGFDDAMGDVRDIWRFRLE